MLSAARARLQNQGPSNGASSESDLSAPASRSRYEPTWTPTTEGDAKRLIYLTESEESFAEGGRLDCDRLSPWFSENSTVLDLGCGIGRVAKFVAPKCAKLWAVDVSERMLEMAAVRLSDFKNVSYVHSQDVSIPEVRDASVDLAYSLLVLQHLEREDAFLLLEELRRLIKPTGTVVLTYPNLLSDSYLESFLQYAHSGASTEPARARFYTPQEVDRLLSAAGFRADLEAETEIRVVAHPV
ncbi:MAG: class I SAM-dependent methyltransferase [Acidimicrobiales bacterium]